jgi:hypothetical protein
MQIADKEIGRKEELLRNLDYLSQQFAHLELVNVLPDELEQREFVVNRALDVRSASMMYLAVGIRHDATPLGTPGIAPSHMHLHEVRQVVKTFFLGDAQIIDSKAYLDNCVENYHRALSSIVGIHMIVKVWEIVKGICSCLECLIVNRHGYIKSSKSKGPTTPD